MNPAFDVPFVSDDNYLDFLIEIKHDLDSVHFSLPHGGRLDNRVLFDSQVSGPQVFDQLARLQGPRKYGLMNSRFYTPALLTDSDNVRPIVRSLEQCLEHGVIDGIVYCDHYLLQRLSDVAPSVAAELEAVPGVNTMLDSYGKIEAQLSYIGETRFKQPGKILLDRSLNRDLDHLASVALKVHQQFRGLKIEVLANEGCLPYCPFKLSHDSYIALANMEGPDSTYDLNCELGCMRLLDEQPHRILQSPFIRPEDIDLYLYHIDAIKLCGRTLGPQFLKRIISAYRERSYDGNLLDLLDAMQWLAEKLYVDNTMLSFDFANMLSSCDSRCDHCGFCRQLFDVVTRPLPMRIHDYRAVVD